MRMKASVRLHPFKRMRVAVCVSLLSALGCVSVAAADDAKTVANSVVLMDVAGQPDQRELTDSEFKGLVADLRTALTASGYSVRLAPASIVPAVTTSVAVTSGELEATSAVPPMPSFHQRLQAGEFGDAQFVISPRVVYLQPRQSHNAIPGTSDFSSRYDLDLLAEFVMVNTQTGVVVASFNASGQGADMSVEKQVSSFVPDMGKVRRQVLQSFSEDARKKLLAQLPKPVDTRTSFFGGKDTAAKTFEGDPKTLKVYKNTEPDKPAARQSGAGVKPAVGGLIIYR